MNNYDFLTLSPSEFVHFVRDILQASRGVFIENFAEGADGGIDLRYQTDSKKLVIVQCKRYKSFTSVLANLKKEVSKVKLLKPSRYIVATSVELTPERKKKIRDLFPKYIKSDADILGRENLNNLLVAHPEVLLRHFKLYISGTAVLKKIIHSKVYNESRFEEAQIKQDLKVYVQNDSFSEALAILQNHFVVLISGHPGMGKTTLARMLVYYLLSKGFDEFAFLSDSISSGTGNYEDGKRIVFFFDDFLGTSFLEDRIPFNEDNRLLKFIASIKRDKKHVLILTTREYILHQAQQSYEKLNDKDLEVSKCVLDLGKYTHLIKAQILANHLFFNNVPGDYITALLQDDIVFELVYHKNFNPRIIEEMIDKGNWHNYPPALFPSVLLQAFDNPESVWLRTYENNISIFSRCALAILTTFPTPVYLDDFEQAVRAFAENNSSYGFQFNPFALKRALKEMHNTFITTSADDKNKIAVSFQNPSIRDFLVNYLSAGPNTRLLKDVLAAAISIEQLTYNIEMQSAPKVDNPFLFDTRRIQITEEIAGKIRIQLVNQYSNLKSTRINQYNSRGAAGFTRYYADNAPFSKLSLLMSDVLYTSQAGQYHDFLVAQMQASLDFTYLGFGERFAFMRLFRKLHSFLSFDEIDLVRRFAKSLSYVSEWSVLVELNEILPKGVAAFKADTELFNDRYTYTIENEKSKDNRNYFGQTAAELERVGAALDFNVAPEANTLKSMMRGEPIVPGLIDLEAIGIPYLSDPSILEEQNEKIKIKRIFTDIAGR